LAPTDETRRNCFAPAARTRSERRSGYSRSTRRNAACDPACLIVVPSAQYASSQRDKSGSLSKSTICSRSFGWVIPVPLRTKAVTLAYSGEASRNWRQCDPTSPVPPAISADLGIFWRISRCSLGNWSASQPFDVTSVIRDERYYITITQLLLPGCYGERCCPLSKRRL